MEFDLFLSHHSKEKPVVRELREALEARGVETWLDEVNLPAGQDWLPLVEEAIRGSRAVAVLVGGSGFGPWQMVEMDGAMRLAVRENRPLIPVLLPGCSESPELPLFLTGRTWVDLRDGIDGEGVDRIIAGIESQPIPEGRALLLSDELAGVRSMVEGHERLTIPARPERSLEARASASSVLASVIDPGILEVIEEAVAKSKDRLKDALSDPANSQQAKDNEVEIAKANICRELKRLRDLNEQAIPEVLEADWRSFGCA